MTQTAIIHLAGTVRNGDVTYRVDVQADGTWTHTVTRDDGDPAAVELNVAEVNYAMAEIERQLTA